MITRIARIDTETDIASLARALYRVERGQGGRNMLQRAEAVLIAANPALRKLNAMVPGRRIIVPQIDGLLFTARVTDNGEAIGNPAAEALGRLSQIDISLELGEESAKLRRERLLKIAGGEEILKIVKNDLDGGAELLETALKATTRAQEVETDKLRRLRLAIDAAKTAFDSMAQRDHLKPTRNGDKERPR